jgi:hypothetical protein
MPVSQLWIQEKDWHGSNPSATTQCIECCCQYIQFEQQMISKTSVYPVWTKHIIQHWDSYHQNLYDHPCQSPPNHHTAWIALHVNHWDRPYVVIKFIEIVYNQIVCFPHETIGCTLEMQTKSNILIQPVSQSVSLSVSQWQVSQWQGYTQLTTDGPGISVNKTQMIESNCEPSGWSSWSANVFFLLSSPAYVSSPSSHGRNSLQTLSHAHPTPPVLAHCPCLTGMGYH